MEILTAFLTLTALELVLGIDNIVFLTILTGRLPVEQQARARAIGLGLAMFLRIGLLFTLSWLVGLTNPLFSVFSEELSGRDLILLIGGLFLVAKSTTEIHNKIEGENGEANHAQKTSGFWSVIAQMLALDVVFSLDSVITAVGMVNDLKVMVAAVVVSVGVMMFFAKPVGDFVDKRPTVKMLALSFLLVIGLSLVAEAFDHHIPKGYIYFSMAFSCLVEMLNLKARKISTVSQQA